MCKRVAVINIWIIIKKNAPRLFQKKYYKLEKRNEIKERKITRFVAHLNAIRVVFFALKSLS